LSAMMGVGQRFGRETPRAAIAAEGLRSMAATQPGVGGSTGVAWKRTPEDMKALQGLWQSKFGADATTPAAANAAYKFGSGPGSLRTQQAGQKERYETSRAMGRRASPQDAEAYKAFTTGQPTYGQAFTVGGPMAGQGLAQSQLATAMEGQNMRNQLALAELNGRGGGDNAKQSEGAWAVYMNAQNEVRRQFPKMTDPNMIHNEAMKRLPPAARALVEGNTQPSRVNLPGAAGPGAVPSTIAANLGPPALPSGNPQASGTTPDPAVLKELASNPTNLYHYLLQNYPHLTTPEAASTLLPILASAGIDSQSVARNLWWIDNFPGTSQLGAMLNPGGAKRRKAATPFWDALSKQSGGS